MNWLIRALIGPAIWAWGFTSVYALHGYGCARGWPQMGTGLGNLHQSVLVLAFLVTFVAASLALLLVPRGEGATGQVVRIGGWIGVWATLLTLFPVLVATSCF